MTAFALWVMTFIGGVLMIAAGIAVAAAARERWIDGYQKRVERAAYDRARQKISDQGRYLTNGSPEHALLMNLSGEWGNRDPWDAAREFYKAREKETAAAIAKATETRS